MDDKLTAIVQPTFFDPVANDVHEHSRRRVYDHEVPVQLADMSHIGQHFPPTADAGCRNRNYQHAVRN